MTRTALYRLFDAADRLLYVGISTQPTRRFGEHAHDHAWGQEVAQTTVEWFDNRETALVAEREAILGEDPPYNIRPRRWRASNDSSPAAPPWIHSKISESQRADLDRIAEAEQRTRSQMIRILLAEAVAARQAPQKETQP